MSMVNVVRLYFILFLHQTTTSKPFIDVPCGCILFCFYIKPQLASSSPYNGSCCILFCFYIKPQLYGLLSNALLCCILFCFYIKPQRGWQYLLDQGGCILFCFYIKPQLKFLDPYQYVVVFYSVSTSNHNVRGIIRLYSRC